ncbi:MAG: type II toxin-antitoxin system HicA family toxin, partial [bacterium]|nr:type II toxin-antitoxin system HicA family toxin [bacterium]
AVVDFLKKNHFAYSHAKGSHHYYVGHYGGQPRIVQVPFHGSKSFKPRTLKGMIKQSGMPQKIWLE